jgi:hypothetical protein
LGFRIRKRKELYTHKKTLRTVLLIICLGDFYLNLRHTLLTQLQIINWNIAYTYEQIAKIKLGNNYKAYKELDQYFKKCVKCCAKHNRHTKYYEKENSAKFFFLHMAITTTIII